MSESKKYPGEDDFTAFMQEIDHGGNATIKSINDCSEGESGLQDGVLEAYGGTGEFNLRIKSGWKIIEIAMQDTSKNQLLERLDIFNTGALIASLRQSISRKSYFTVSNEEEAKVTPPPEDAILEFTTTRRDGKKVVRYATKDTIDIVMKEVEKEQENERRLGAFCDNMETDLALRDQVKTKKGMGTLVNNLKKTEIFLHESILARIAAGEITEESYRRKFN